ncbi:MAG: hypothetical protein RMA76_23390 [Deltaproteobacteria bacterium]|jgi:hypothetical protein
MLNPFSWWLAKLAELRAGGSLFIRFAIAAFLVFPAAAMAMLLLLRGLVFDSPLDELRACTLAMEYARGRNMTPSACTRFSATDSLGSIVVHERDSSSSLTVTFSGGALPFQRWHVDGVRRYLTDQAPPAAAESNTLRASEEASEIEARPKVEMIRAVQHDDED